MKNVTKQDKKIKIYKNSSPHTIEFTLFSSGNWRILPIKNINDNDFFDVYLNGNLFKKYNLKSDMSEFKDNIVKTL
jgi:antitoxin component YwqK of YwqJK toxin-antitoxin module